MAEIKPGIKDITGRRFGYLVAVEPTDRRQGSNVIWRFRCDCGNFVEKVMSCLSEYSNCGCIGNEALRRKNLIPGVNDLVTVRSDLANEWDFEKNGLKRPENRSVKSSDKVYWRCPKGHPSYLQVISNRTSLNQGCPYCSHNKVVPGETDLATLRPDLLSDWDYEKNIISPNEIAAYSKTEVYWKCEEGHSYLKAVRDRAVQVYGCPWCANKKRVLANENDLMSQYPEKIRMEWDFEKNTINPSMVTAWDRQKAWWKCEKGHSYQQQIDNHIKVGQGCPYCANKSVWTGFNDVVTTHPWLVVEWHEDNKKKPEDCIAGSHASILWKCKDCGNVWSAAIKSRAYSKQGCPRCALAYRSSEPEQVLFYYLRKTFPKAVNSYKANWLGRMEIDIFIPELNAGIELDGGKWHKNTTRDVKKASRLREHGITLFRLRDERNPEIDDGSIIIPVSRDIDKNIVNMEPYVQKLIERINQEYGSSIVVDINIRRDLTEIQSLFDTKKKGQSVASDQQKLKEWNWEKNTIRPERLGRGSQRNVWWKCSLCGEEWMMPPHRKKGTGCETCKRKAAMKQRLLDMGNAGKSQFLTDYPDLIEEWSYEKNGDLDPAKMLHGSERRVWWKCRACGCEWQTMIRNRARQGHGCPCCREAKRGQHLLLKIRCVETGEEYLGLYKTAKQIGVSVYSLKKALGHPNKVVGGFHWIQDSLETSKGKESS